MRKAHPCALFKLKGIEKMFKKIASVFLTICIIVGALSVGIIPASATTDYSNLTPNQYISKILLNCNYYGCANDFGASDSTIPKDIFEYWLNPENVSVAKVYCDAMKENKTFMNSVTAWEIATFNPATLVDDILKEEDYYSAILFSILDAKVEDNQFIKGLNCSLNNTIISISKNTTSFLKNWYGITESSLNKVDISQFTDSQMESLLYDIGQNDETKRFWQMTGENIEYISLGIKGCTTVYDVVKTVSTYAELANSNDATLQCLNAIIRNAGDNAGLSSAASKVYNYLSGALSKEMLTFLESRDSILDFTYSEIVKKIWKNSVTTALGYFGTGLLIGQAIGRTLSNFCFSTDTIVEQYYALCAITEFENVLIKAISSLSSSYINYESKENADSYIRILELLIATYSLGCDYTYSYVDTVYNKGLVNTIVTAFGESKNSIEAKANINAIKNNTSFMYYYLSLDGYSAFYEVDAPNAYSNNIDFETNQSYIIPVNRVNFDIDTYTLFKNQYVVNSATVSPSNATDQSITYYSRNTNIATVDQTGKIVPVNPGTVTIYAKASNGVTGSCEITILPFEVSESNNGYTITEYIGKETYANIPKIVNGVPIIAIGDEAFYNRANLTNIMVPDSVTSIGDKAFSDCESLTNITIPNSVKNIGDYAFLRCTSLTSITIPNSVISIGSYAFSYCTSLTSIEIPNSVTSIGRDVFSNCKSLASITIPNSVTSIGSYAFSYCTSLTSIEIPNSVTSIGRDVFSNCKSLASITIPNSVTSIGVNAFLGCKSLISVTIGKGVTSIGGWSFVNCESLTSITVDNNNTSYSSLDGVLFNKDKTEIICYPRGKTENSYIIPDSVTSIGSCAFNGCTNLTNITIPNSVTSIGVYAFYFCTSLTNITIPDNVTSIGVYAFLGCRSFRYIIIPNNVISIGYNAFGGPYITLCNSKNIADLLESANCQYRRFGDFDNDKKLSSTDVAVMRKSLLGTFDASYSEKIADINQDNVFNILDLVRLKKQMVS